MRATLLRLARVLAADVEDISDAEEVAMERREFEEAVHRVSLKFDADALLNFVKRWRWDEEIPTDVDSPHVDWRYADNLPHRSPNATTVADEFIPRLNSVGSALASKLGIDAQSPLMKVLSATVRCVSMLESRFQNFNKASVKQSLAVACREYTNRNNNRQQPRAVIPTYVPSPRPRAVIPTYVPEEPVRWAVYNGRTIPWHPLRD